MAKEKEDIFEKLKFEKVQELIAAIKRVDLKKVIDLIDRYPSIVNSFGLEENHFLTSGPRQNPLVLPLQIAIEQVLVQLYGRPRESDQNYYAYCKNPACLFNQRSLEILEILSRATDVNNKEFISSLTQELGGTAAIDFRLSVFAVDVNVRLEQEIAVLFGEPQSYSRSDAYEVAIAAVRALKASERSSKLRHPSTIKQQVIAQLVQQGLNFDARGSDERTLRNAISSTLGSESAESFINQCMAKQMIEIMPPRKPQETRNFFCCFGGSKQSVGQSSARSSDIAVRAAAVSAAASSPAGASLAAASSAMATRQLHVDAPLFAAAQGGSSMQSPEAASDEKKKAGP